MRYFFLSSPWVIIIFLFPVVFNLAANEITKPKIQLATVYAEPEAINDYWVSEKLDGVRGYWNGKSIYTRQGHIIKVPDYFIKNWPDIAMDGELWIARQRFEDVSAIVRTSEINPDAWQQIHFMIFDLPEHSGDFSARIHTMQQVVEKANNRHLAVIKQYTVTSIDELNNTLAEVTSNGGEGLMLHHKSAKYHVGRTNHIMKLKTYFDAEATVVQYIEGKGKYQGMLGSMLVETPDGIRFKIGSGFTDELRQNPPAIGSSITYKYFGKTKFNIPKFASFMRVKTEP